jgi:8-oxo-dGTP pyrophosphatase MutT (NUDIX family)
MMRAMPSTPSPSPDATAWPALAASRALDRGRRLPFLLGGQLVGSVDRAHLPMLEALPSLHLHDDGLHLLPEAGQASAALAWLNTRLRDDGLIRGWRDETFPVLADDGRTLAHTERAAARFWGLTTRAAHANGLVLDHRGRPQALWIARRALSKATDPGRLDNVVAGGVPLGQTPFETLLREGWEEAGLPQAVLCQARAGSVLHLLHDCPHGLMRERLHVYDIVLPAGLQPVNQDGEVAEFRLMPVAEAFALAAGSEMTVDAALATLDFALRHDLLAVPDLAAWQALRSAPPFTGFEQWREAK